MFKNYKLASGITVSLLGVIGIIASAQAVHLNPDGTGQVLLFPYFNAQDGYVTNINLVNSSDQAKAVKIRFHEGKASNDVLDFNIYMDADDVWTGSIKSVQDNSGTKVGSLTTRNRTCTLPALASCDDGKCETTVPFSGYNLFQGVAASDTQEGFVEVIEMGVIEDATVKAGVAHAKGKPANCKTVADAWTKGTFTAGTGAAAKGLTAPTGGLFGSSAVLNVTEGSAYTVEPVAIDNYSTQAQHYQASDPDHFLLPSLASGNVTTSSVMVHKASGETELVETEWKPTNDACLVDADPLTPACGNNPYPVAHVLLATSLMNEYFLDPTSGYDGHTDWVVTFPMKQFGIQATANDVRVSFANGLFDRESGLAGSTTSTASKVGFITTTSSGTTASVAGMLNREVNVLSFKSTDPSYDAKRTLLSSTNKQIVSVGPLVSGWARLAFGNYSLKDGFKAATAYGAKTTTYTADNEIYQGVPATGVAFIGGNVGENKVARFGDAITHKVQRNIPSQ